MSRSEEQRDADDALTAAIERVWFAYYPDTEPGILMEYVVNARRRTFDEDDGSPLTSNATMPRDGNVPLDTLLGLQMYGALRTQAQIQQD
ncbi:hypothetical protein CH296_27830 [Rhodococcus sp. 14-2496-1d]|uniref:hypothetical protein n=1 Tax=Rhodococcus sp. 14-2496-1d TaxID=2023146 RepID=UPI000B9A9DFE|nr:hypothetical protein [Rhodococcus sp. 14-2496-1d]OZF25348.1 hypothetical protein CH296_27830 [Rhodococcus sp. 14-2496-1d]